MKINNKYLPAGFLILVLRFTSVTAQEIGYPVQSNLHNQDENSEYGRSSSILVDCEASKYGDKQSVTGIRCSFAQVFIKHVLDPAELNATIERKRQWHHDEFKDMSEEDYDMLKEMVCYDDMVARASEEEVIESYQRTMGPNSEPLIGLSKEICGTDSIEEIKRITLEMMVLTNQWSTKKCKVWKNNWTEEFTLQESADGKYWYANPEPSGTCQIVNLSALKRSEDGVFWNYESKRLVLSPDAESPLSCRSLQKNPMRYGPVAKSVFMDCRELVH